MTRHGVDAGLDHALDQWIRRRERRRAVHRVPQTAQDVGVAVVVLCKRDEHFVIHLGSPEESAIRAASDAARDALDEGRTRTLAVKSYAARSEGRAATAELLIGDPQRGSDLMQSSSALGEWSEREPALGLADYLLGKNLYARFRWREANAHIGRALERELPLASVQLEALRVGILAACALGEQELARSRLREYLGRAAAGEVRKQGMRKFAVSCGLEPIGS